MLRPAPRRRRESGRLRDRRTPAACVRRGGAARRSSLRECFPHRWPAPRAWECWSWRWRGMLPRARPARSAVPKAPAPRSRGRWAARPERWTGRYSRTAGPVLRRGNKRQQEGPRATTTARRSVVLREIAARKRKSRWSSEAPVGIEPTNRGFADLCLTTWLRRRVIQGLNLQGQGLVENPRTATSKVAHDPQSSE